MTRAKDISKIITDADFSGTLDVTGTVTAGGLTVDTNTLFVDASTNEVGINTTNPFGELHVRGTSASVYIQSDDGQPCDIIFGDETDQSEGRIRYDSSDNMIFQVDNLREALRIANNGDISFYEDTGTTPKFFWDSSAECLNVGTTTSEGNFNVNISTPSDYPFRLTNTSSTGYGLLVTAGDGSSALAKFRDYAGNDRVYISGAGNVGIGTSSPTQKLEVSGKGVFSTANPDVNGLKITATTGTNASAMTFSNTATAYVGLDNSVGGRISGVPYGLAVWNGSAYPVVFGTNGSERMRIDSSGRVGIGQTPTLSIDGSVGITISEDGYMQAQRSGTPTTIFALNRIDSDGTLISFRQAGVQEGTISVSGTTVSYNGGHLSRWSQLTDNTRDSTIVKGTVMTNLDQMAEWTTDGVTEDNEQLNCMAVSSVEGDANVAGVFVNWDNDDDIYTNDMNIAMTGDMVIRIAQGTTVARGDLLMSAGDGTAKPQGDDIVRSKTIAKVTSTNVSHTYDDGTYLVPCVLMAC